MIDKRHMSEEDIKLRFITPAITAKWNLDHITMETHITDGKINLKGNLVFREKPKKADYVLYINVNNPIAIVEAKDNKHTVSYGLQQAMTYAQMLDVPFVYSFCIRCYSYLRVAFARDLPDKEPFRQMICQCHRRRIIDPKEIRHLKKHLGKLEHQV